MSDDKLVPKLRFEFSSSWESKKLKDIIQISKEKYNPDSDKTNYKCIELEHLAQETGLLLGYTDSINQNSIKNKFHEDNILFGKLRPYLKKFYYTNFVGVCSSEIWVFNTNEYSKYIYYLIQTKKFLDISNVSAGSKMPRSDWNFMKNFVFSIPDIKTQKEIANLFSMIDNKIELLKKKYQQYQNFKKYLMQQIFTQKLRFDFDEDWYIGKIGNNSEVFGRIGFRGYTVDDLVDKGEGALTIGGKHISKDFQLDLSDPEYLSWEKYEESPEIKIYNNDVLLVKTASVGKVCFIENLNEPATLNPQLIVFKNIKLNNKFFYYYLTSNLFQKDIHKIKSTTGIPTITQKELLNLNIIYPSLKEQERIVNFLSTVDKKISAIDKNLKDIKKFKNGLLQQMFI